METLGALLTWAMFGLVVGAIARLAYPGRQRMGLLMTMLLGVIGSLVGGLISWGLTGGPEDGPLQGASWIMSIIGALIVVWLGLFSSSRRTT